MKIGFAFIIKNTIFRWEDWKKFLKDIDHEIALISWDRLILAELEKYQIETSIQPGHGDYNYIRSVFLLFERLKDCDRVILLSESCYPMVSSEKLLSVCECVFFYYSLVVIFNFSIK